MKPKILILEKNPDGESRALCERILTILDYPFRSFQSIYDSPDAVPDPQAFLAEFDYAIIHPALKESPIVLGELKRRDNFRIDYVKANGSPEFQGRLVFNEDISISEIRNWINKNN